MDLIKSIMETEINEEKVARIQALYDEEFPVFIQKMLSLIDDVVFLDNDFRMLSYEEILNAKEELHVDFNELGILPLIDCGENDFISFGTKDESWFKYNIVEKIKFKERDSLEELL